MYPCIAVRVRNASLLGDTHTCVSLCGDTCPYLVHRDQVSSVKKYWTGPRYRAVEPSSGSNVIPRRARPGLAGLGPLTVGRDFAAGHVLLFTSETFIINTAGHVCTPTEALSRIQGYLTYKKAHPPRTLP